MKKLVLRKETMRVLTDVALDRVAGGTSSSTVDTVGGICQGTMYCETMYACFSEGCPRELF